MRLKCSNVTGEVEQRANDINRPNSFEVMTAPQPAITEVAEQLKSNIAACTESLQHLQESISQLLASSTTTTTTTHTVADDHVESWPHDESRPVHDAALATAAGAAAAEDATDHSDDDDDSISSEGAAAHGAEFPDEEACAADELRRLREEAYGHRPWADKLLRSMLPTEIIVRDVIFPPGWNTGRKINTLNMIYDFDERGYVLARLLAGASDEDFWEYIRVRTYVGTICTRTSTVPRRTCRTGIW